MIRFLRKWKTKGDSRSGPWREDETRESVMVFIGRKLPENSVRRVFETCVTT